MTTALGLTEIQLNVAYETRREANSCGLSTRHLNALGMMGTSLYEPIASLPEDWQHHIRPDRPAKTLLYGELPLLFGVRCLDEEVLLQVEFINPLSGELLSTSRSTITSLYPAETGSTCKQADCFHYTRNDVSFGVRRLRAQAEAGMEDLAPPEILGRILPVTII